MLAIFKAQADKEQQKATRPNEMNEESRDKLTGLLGPEQARETISRWQEDWPRGAGACPMHAMLITLGRFDTVNVAFGESVGDGALVEVAHRIQHFAGDELESSVWLAARLSGGNFLLVAREECSRERWQWLAEALADALAMPIANAVVASSSLRLWPRIALMRAIEGDTASTIFDRLAETAAAIREDGGRRIAWSNGFAARSGRSTHELEADLLAAIDRDEIEILFQPQFALGSEELVGAEALARWQHPQLGRISAGVLFQIAERVDHVAQLSRHIADRALQAATSWPAHLRLSLNVTPADLSADSFAMEFARLTERTGFSLSRVTLEITEQVLLGDLERVSHTLDQCKMLDLTIALDDFGAGFCNFRYLKVLPIDLIKLDRSMNEGVLEDERDRAVFRAIMAMAQALDIGIVVEGVETPAQRAFAAEEGARYYQGFLRAEPISAAQFLALAAQGRQAA